MALLTSTLRILSTLIVQLTESSLIAQTVLRTELPNKTFLIVGATQWCGVMTNPFNGTAHALRTLQITGTLHVLIARRAIFNDEATCKDKAKS